MRMNRLHMERLEDRQLMAGDVAGYVQNGNLYLNEAAGQYGLENRVSITRLDNNQIRVTGLAGADGVKSLINAAAYQDFWVLGGLFVNFGGGSDRVVINVPTTGGPSFSQIHIDVAGPPSTPVNQQFAAFATRLIEPFDPFETPDHDHVAIWKAPVTGAIDINTGRGDDYVSISQWRSSSVNVTTGAGADTVKLQHSVFQSPLNHVDIQTYDSIWENDVDNVTVENVWVFDYLRARLGGGNDTFNLNYVRSSWGDIDVDAGAGNDVGQMVDLMAWDEIMARLGEGSDALSVNNVRSHRLSLLGDGGFDSLTKSGDVTGISQFTQTGWEYVNGFPIWGNIFANLTFATSVMTMG